MKNKLFYIVIILFICCAEDDDNNFHNSYKFKGTNHTLDIVSWNIENFPKNDVTINEMIPIIDSLNVDIIALQEIESTQDFNNLVNQLGDNWIGYRSQNSSYGVLAYLINTTDINIASSPYTILNNSSYYFASKPPYVLEFSFNNINYILIDVHYKSDYDGDWSDRRETANYLLYEYINEHYNSNKLIVVGDFNDDVKYGYINVGKVVDGPKSLLNKSVFSLFPHQDIFKFSVNDLTMIPKNIPLKRSLLIPNLETAINAIWDTLPSPGDRVIVLGAGVVGLLTANILNKIFTCISAKS